MKRNDFYKGQRLETPYIYYEDWPNCDRFVTVTSINKKFDIVHYKLNINYNIAGELHSGMYFNEAREYLPNK